VECVTGVPFTYDPSGVLLTCAEPIHVGSLGDVGEEFMYLVERLPTYVVAGGAVVGLLVLLVTALVVKELVS